MSDPYPFESADDIEISELALDVLDEIEEEGATVGQLAVHEAGWRYGHVIVDEAQDLTPMQWRMILRRVRGRGLTIVGDAAQRTGGDLKPWSDLLPSQLDGLNRVDLSINYRNPLEVAQVAAALLPQDNIDVQPARSLRSVGEQPQWYQRESIVDAVTAWIESLKLAHGRAVAIGASAAVRTLVLDMFGGDSVADLRWMTPVQAKGLEFDHVLVVDPHAIATRPNGDAELFIAVSRATTSLAFASTRLPMEHLQSLVSAH